MRPQNVIPEYDLYLFDFDNTLFDTSYGIGVMLRNALPAIGIEYDETRFTDYLGMSIDDIFDSYAKDASTYDEYCRRIYEVVNSDSYVGARPFPDALVVLMELKARGKRIGIVSGKMRYKIEALLEANGLRDIPETVVGWDDTDRHKPEPDPIALGFSRFDVPLERSVYVGDSANDTGAANAFGMDCIIVNRPNGMGMPGLPCTYEVASLEEILRSDHSLARHPDDELPGLLDTRLGCPGEVLDGLLVIHPYLSRQRQRGEVVHG